MSVDPMKKLTSWSCGAPRLRLLYVFIRICEDIGQVELCSSQTQNALRSCYILLGN